MPGATPQDLAGALLEAVASVAPDAQWLPGDQPLIVASPTSAEFDGALLGGAGSLARAGRTGRVAVYVGTMPDAFACYPDSNSSCEVGLSPEGVTMATRRYWDSGYPDWTATWRVDLALADGLVLEVYAYASKQVEFGELGPVLSKEELITVSDDIARRITA